MPPACRGTRRLSDYAISYSLPGELGKGGGTLRECITGHPSPIAYIVPCHPEYVVQNTLHMVKIVIKSDKIPCLVLNLPPLPRRASTVRLGFCAEPNPTRSGPQAIPAPSNRPFRDKAEGILFSVLIEDIQIYPGHFHFPETRPFTFIVHRRVHLNHIPPVFRACTPFCSTPEPAPENVQVRWEAWGAWPRATLRRCVG